MWTCEFNDTLLSCAPPCCPLQHVQYAHSPAIHHRTFHKHTHCHLMFCTGGRGFLRVNNLEITLKPGILAVIRPGEYHSCGATEDSDLEFWALSFSPAGEDDTLYQSLTDGRCVSASFEGYLDYVQGAFRYIHMLAAGEQPGDSHSTILQGQILSLIQFAGIMRQLHPLDVPAGDLPLREMLDWISEHFAENISLSSLSREFAMSTSHLSRSFFAAFQISPINYLIEYRLTRASDLLIHTDLPIHTVAARVGYGNTYYFFNLFAKRTGCTPQEFRYRCTHSDTMPEDVSM